MLELALSAVVGIVIAVAMTVLVLRRQKAEKRSAEQLKLALAEGQQVPMSLHPVIDATLCVGSFSCIKACPEGEIIGVVDGVATLVEAAHCIGHASCAVECPVGAIKLVFGTAERGIDLPEADDQFESSRPGVFIIGELGGMGLIKNALRQGLVLGKQLKAKLKRNDLADSVVDVVIVGAGPAGVACAVQCKQEGLSARIFEQESIGGTIAHYPRGKVVMSEQIVMPNYGPFGASLLSKEDLIDEIHELLKKNKIKVDEGHKVVKIEGDNKIFTVTTSKGTSVNCRAVVLAIGLRGSPQKLGCAGEELDKVMYRLIEPEQFHGERVLVVGGGDSAVEAAIQLAEESTAKVSISYRQPAFTRCKPRNKEKIDRLINDGRIRALMGTKVTSIEEGLVRLEAADGDDKKGGGAEVKRDELAAKAPKEPPPPPMGTGVRESSRKMAAQPLPAVPTDAEKTMMADGALLGRPPPGAKPVDEHRSAITGRWGAKPLDEPAAPAAAGAAPHQSGGSGEKSVSKRVQNVSLSRSSTGPKEERGPSMKDGPKSAVGALGDKLKSGVRIIIGGRAQSIEDLEEGNSSMSMQRVRPPTQAGVIESGREDSSASIARSRKQGEVRLKNDKVIISIGGQLPTAFLNSIGVNTRKYMGEEKGASGTTAKGKTKRQIEDTARRRLAMTLFLLGASIIAGLLLIGKEYYWIPVEDRPQSALHPLLKPSGLWGHGVGVAATTFMLANFLYALRKRWGRLKGTASIRTWLTFHMFVGIMSPLVIAFHAAFLVNNLLAVWTWVALAVVVGTGVFGRFLFSFVPAQAGKMLQVTDLRAEVADINAVLAPKMAETKNFAHVTGLFQSANLAPEGRTLMKAVLRERTVRAKLIADIDKARPMFNDAGAFQQFKEGLIKVNRARMQISFYAALKRIFRAWLVVHVVVAIFMVVLIGAHVAVTTYLGYMWIFSKGGG
jgi:thioredoxin reductase/Pyruvate/2-oxoacid:ferredoxin oxidoreductase delta subunit